MGCLGHAWMLFWGLPTKLGVWICWVSPSVDAQILLLLLLGFFLSNITKRNRKTSVCHTVGGLTQHCGAVTGCCMSHCHILCLSLSTAWRILSGICTGFKVSVGADDTLNLENILNSSWDTSVFSCNGMSQAVRAHWDVNMWRYKAVVYCYCLLCHHASMTPKCGWTAWAGAKHELSLKWQSCTPP